MEKRKISVMVRFTKNEAEAIDKKRGKTARAVFIRLCVNEAKISPPIPSINIEARAELSKIGNNLNQIAKAANSGLDIDISEVKKEISKLRLVLIGIQKCEQ